MTKVICWQSLTRTIVHNSNNNYNNYNNNYNSNNIMNIGIYTKITNNDNIVVPEPYGNIVIPEPSITC